MTVTRSENWKAEDHSVYLVHNWTDVRQRIAIKDGGSNGLVLDNNTIATSNGDWTFGQNVIWNETAIRETHFVVNGKDSAVRNRSASPYAEGRLHFLGYRCWPVDSCLEKINFSVPLNGTLKLWSDPANWPNNTVPKDGDDVHVEAGWNMIYDLNHTMVGNDTPPVFKLVRVNGNLTI